MNGVQFRMFGERNAIEHRRNYDVNMDVVGCGCKRGLRHSGLQTSVDVIMENENEQNVDCIPFPRPCCSTSRSKSNPALPQFAYFQGLRPTEHP